jgi:hypothetical protein
MTHRLFPLILLACLGGCARAAPPVAVAVESGKFDALRNVTAHVPQAPGPDVTRESEVDSIKAFASEMALLKKVPLNAPEQSIFAEYQKALDAYQFSLDLWAEKIRRQNSTAGGDRVPVQIDTMKLTSLLDGAALYHLPLLDETLPGGVALKVLPSDAPHRVWIAGDEALAHAVSMLAAATTAR